jgi:hypothetical protein
VRPSIPRKSSKRPHLSPKQALFLKGYTDRKSPTFGNAYQSAVAAGYASEYARKITTVLSENVSATMVDALDHAGATDDILAKRHAELLNKREVIVVHEGKESHHELTDQPDTNAVKAALDMAYKLKKHYPAERLEHDFPPGTITFIRSSDAGDKRPADSA